MYNFKPVTYAMLAIFLVFFALPVQIPYADTQPRDDATSPEIRVSLGLNLSNATVTLPKGGTIFDPLKNKQAAKFSKNNELSLKFSKNKISVKGIKGEYSNLIFKPSSGSFIIFKGKQYRGSIRAVATNSGIWIINHVDMEDYLYGVVPFEVPMSWNIEAIKAQAVAARTYAVRCLSQYPHGEFDVYDSVRDQVYGGVDGEKESAIIAVDGTRGIIMSYQGWPIKAYYSADAGGQTAEGKYIFPGDLPYLQSVPSKDDLEKHRWHFLLKKSELESLMKAKNFNVGKIKDVKITSISPTGRPRNVEVVGSKGTHDFSSNNFRKMIGAGRIRSTLFSIVGNNNHPEVENAVSKVRTISPAGNTDGITVVSDSGNTRVIIDEYYVLGSDGIGCVDESEMKIITTNSSKVYKPKTDIKPSDDEFLFVGSGFGHGVGMSQWGAKAYADDGWDYRDILLHYYRGADLTIWY